MTRPESQGLMGRSTSPITPTRSCGSSATTWCRPGRAPGDGSRHCIADSALRLSSRRTMDCCAHCAGIGSVFDRKVAEADLRRYRRRGPDPSTRLILEELRRQPLDGTHLLDVGGGIGVMGLELLATGIAHVVEVDAWPAYLAVAGRQFAERGWAERATLVAGDFATLAQPPEPADVVTLDRVVCCYPDYGALLARAAACARSVLALS